MQICKHLLLFSFFLHCCSSAHGDVGLLLAEATPHGVSQWTNAGHAAIYFSNICPASPVRLRLCNPGENGSVLNNYENFDEDQPYDWNIVPADVYIYGTEDEEKRPLFASTQMRTLLQDRFLERFLYDVCAGPPCTTNPRARWRDLVGASFTRGMYIFIVKTTRDQDLRLIDELNSRPNRNRYNGFRNNCADFSERVINTYFPGAARRDHVNDFDMTSPKAIAKSFAHFAKKHPELEYRVAHIPQLPGDFKRSMDCRKGTEVAFRSRRWLLPMLLKPHELGLFATSYLFTGRFNPQREFERHPAEFGSEQTAADDLSQRGRNGGADASFPDSAPTAGASLAEIRRADTDRDEWRSYSSEIAQLRGESSLPETPARGAASLAIRRLAREIDERGGVIIDADGLLWIEVATDGGIRRIGASAGNIGSPKSDPELAYRILLDRLEAEIKSAPKRRESLPEFKADWQLLEVAHAQMEREEHNQRPGSPQAIETLIDAGQSLR